MRLVLLCTVVACAGTPSRARPPMPASEAAPRLGGVWRELSADAPVTAFVTEPLAGPYAGVGTVCLDLGKTSDECWYGDDDELYAPTSRFLATRHITTEEDSPVAFEVMDRRTYLVIRTARGYWVTGAFEGIGGRGGATVEAQVVDEHLVVRYHATRAHEGQRAGSTSIGLAICKVDPDGRVRCTPRIPTGARRYETRDNDDPGGVETSTLACAATFARGQLTVAPSTRRDDDLDPEPTPAATDACTRLPYAGTRPVR